MKIHFIKTSHRQHRLECLRDDGTRTGADLDSTNSVNFMAHDLLHYVLEKNAGLTGGFYGQIASGTDIEAMIPGRMSTSTDVQSGGQVQIDPTTESHLAEMLVGMLTSVVQGRVTEPQFLEALQNVCLSQGIPVPTFITEDFIQTLKKDHHALLARWKELSVAGTLDLDFPSK